MALHGPPFSSVGRHGGGRPPSAGTSVPRRERACRGGRLAASRPAVYLQLLENLQGFPSCSCPPLEETSATIAAERARKGGRFNPFRRR
jgi:hypothetical protein